MPPEGGRPLRRGPQGAREGVRTPPPAAHGGPVPGPEPGDAGRRGRGSVRDVRARAAGRPGPAVRLGAAALRPGRPDRRRHPGRSHLDRHGRLLRPAPAAHAERGARDLPAGHRAGRGPGPGGGAGPVLGDRQAGRGARPGDARRAARAGGLGRGRAHPGHARRAPSRGHGPRASPDRVLRGLGGRDHRPRDRPRGGLLRDRELVRGRVGPPLGVRAPVPGGPDPRRGGDGGAVRAPRAPGRRAGPCTRRRRTTSA